MLLENKTALITGAASGIGAAAARVFSAHGANVVLADVNDDGGQQVADEVVKDGGQALFVHADVSSASDVEAAVRAAVARFGVLDCAFNNAGIDGQAAPLHESTKDNWDQVLKVNLTGVWLCLKYEIAQMLHQGGGTIVNTSSGAGLVGLDNLAVSAYVAAKHGVVGLTKQAALEYAKRNIRVNAVCPGPVRTRMLDGLIQAGHLAEADLLNGQPISRLALPADIAEAAAWLCGDTSALITGHALAVDGGWTAR